VSASKHQQNSVLQHLLSFRASLTTAGPCACGTVRQELQGAKIDARSLVPLDLLWMWQDMRLGQEPNIHVYNAMLFALLESKKCVEAYSVLDEMERYRVKANHQTDSLLHRYGLQCSIDERQDVFGAQDIRGQ